MTSRKSTILLAATLLGATTIASAQTLTFVKLPGSDRLFVSEYLASLGQQMGDTFKTIEARSVDQMLKMVAEGKADLALALKRTNRKADVRWSKPILSTETTLLIRKSEGKRPSDLRGKLVCAMPVPSDTDFVKSIGAKALPCANTQEKFKNLLANRCAASVAPIEMNLRFARENPDLKKTFRHYKKAVNPQMLQFAFAVSKSNKALQKKLNRAIQKTVEDGSYQELLAKYSAAR